MVSINRTLIAVIGPPGAGKTTLTRSLAEALPAPVITPPAAINSALADHPGLQGMFTPDGDLGWVPDPAMRLAVRHTITRLAPAAEHIVLEHIPWDAQQLADLHCLAEAINSALVLLNLNLPLGLARQRASHRKQCPICHHPGQGPHTRECLRCGHPLQARRDDRPAHLTKRLAHHQANHDAILALATALHVPTAHLDARLHPNFVLDHALAALLIRRSSVRPPTETRLV